jgi:hypothetical protein
MVAGSLALGAAAAFVGASLYLNLVEQPARLALDDEALTKEWEPSDHRGFALLAALAVFSAVAGLVAFREANDFRWLLGALVILASWPYVYFAIVPLNNRILAYIGAGAAAEARGVIDLWGKLEAGQTLIGLAASIVFVWAAN